MDKKLLLQFSVAGAIFLAAFWHFAHWSGDSLAVIPLSIKSAIGVANDSELKAYSKMCVNHMVYDCAEESLIALSEKTKKSSDFQDLAHLQRLMKKYSQAATAYQLSIDIGAKEGLDKSDLAESYFGLARCAAELKHFDTALENYAKAVKAKPNVIQVTVTENYIELLKKLGKEKEAKNVVQEARRRGNSNSLFASLMD